MHLLTLCHSNKTRAPTADLPNSAQLEGTLPLPFPKLTTRSVQLCGNAARDIQSHRRLWLIYISPRLCLTRNVIIRYISGLTCMNT